jgi:hypothetical protein
MRVMAREATMPRELPDEVLERLGLTRERWYAIRDEQQKRAENAPNVGDVAHVFNLPKLSNRDEMVSLSDFRDKRPVGLVFGSYT